MAGSGPLTEQPELPVNEKGIQFLRVMAGSGSLTEQPELPVNEKEIKFLQVMAGSGTNRTTAITRKLDEIHNSTGNQNCWLNCQAWLPGLTARLGCQAWLPGLTARLNCQAALSYTSYSASKIILFRIS